MMMPEPGSSMRPLQVLFTAIVGTLLAGGSVLSIGHRLGDERWGEMEDWVERNRPACQHRNYHRPVAWGESREGLAFAHYDGALRLAQPLSRDPALFRLWQGKLEYAEVISLRCAWAPALAILHAGAHCEDATPSRFFVTHRESALPDLDIRACIELVRMALFDSKARLEAGDPRGAVEQFLDVATLAADFVRSPLHRCFGPLLTVVASGCTEEWLQHWDHGALDLLAEGLRRIDALPCPALAIDDSLVHQAVYEVEEEDSPHGHLGRPSWRFLGSTRWMTATGILSMAEWLDRMRDAPWLFRRQELVQWEGAPSGVPIWMVRCEQEQRRSAAHLRVLRLSVDHHLGLPPVVLEDPLAGGPIAIETAAEGPRFVCGAGIEPQPVARTAVTR
jgi:hypothetical protein